MMLRMMAIIAAGLCQFGCASAAGLEAGAPDLSFETARNAEDVAGCIGRAWSVSGNPVNTQIRKDGFAIALQGAWGAGCAGGDSASHLGRQRGAVLRTPTGPVARLHGKWRFRLPINGAAPDRLEPASRAMLGCGRNLE